MRSFALVCLFFSLCFAKDVTLVQNRELNPQSFGLPLGAIMTWTKTEDPDPDVWIECDGREIDPVKFPKLRAMASHTPNYLERFLRGGTRENVGEQQEDAIGKHDLTAWAANYVYFEGSPEPDAVREPTQEQYLYASFYANDTIRMLEFNFDVYFFKLLARQIQAANSLNNFLLEDEQRRYFLFHTNAWDLSLGSDYAFSYGTQPFFRHPSFSSDEEQILNNYYKNALDDNMNHITVTYDKSLYIGNPDFFGDEDETRPRFVYQRFFIKGK